MTVFAKPKFYEFCLFLPRQIGFRVKHGDPVYSYLKLQLILGCNRDVVHKVNTS